MLKSFTMRLSAATALALVSSGAIAANAQINTADLTNGLSDIYSANFDGALAGCGVGSSTYCTFFGGDPGATRNITIAPDPTTVENGVPGGIGPTGIPVAPVPAAGSFLNLTLGAGNTTLTLGVSSITFGDVDICIGGQPTCATANVHAENAGIVINAPGAANPGALTPVGGGSTGATVPVDANGRAVFQVQNPPTIMVDFSRFSQVVTSCAGAACALITADVLNLDVVRYVLEIDYDASFTSFTGNFIGETSNNSIITVTLNSNDLDSDNALGANDNCPVTPNAAQTNSDADARGDACDNCSATSNLNQLDSNQDGYGNICDADLNNSNLTTSTDFNLLRSVLNQSSGASALAAAADMNGSGLVTSTDFNLLRARLNTVPGPSGLACAGTIPCVSP
jgi:hypothetical protein